MISLLGGIRRVWWKKQTLAYLGGREEEKRNCKRGDTIKKENPSGGETRWGGTGGSPQKKDGKRRDSGRNIDTSWREEPPR